MDAVLVLHRELFGRLPSADLRTAENEPIAHALRFLFPRLWPEAKVDAMNR